MPFLRIALLPFAWLYGAVLAVRHALYDSGILRSIRPSVPTIAIGNLALGGTGKTPMMELVLRVLEGERPLAALSRGYGRSSTDIREVRADDTAQQSGDEPVQVKVKFPAVRVFVGADRVAAVENIQREVPGVRVVVLDDALQHRRIAAGLNILLTTWHRPWYDDALVPAGRLRDLPSRARVPQVVVVTKCPALPDAKTQKDWRERLRLEEGQELFFSGIEYEKPTSATGGSQSPVLTGELSTTSCLLITGIADPAPLVAHAQELFIRTEHIAFPDHHTFTPGDLAKLEARFDTFAPAPKMLVTTEKDAARLRSMIAGSPLEGLPLATIGMRAVILNEPERFGTLIRDHVATHPAHR